MASLDYHDAAKHFKLPEPKAGHHNNVVWDCMLPVHLIRMDHSISLHQHLGSISDSKGKLVANVSLALGGFVLQITPMVYKGHGRATFALDLHETCKLVLSLMPELGKSKEYPYPRKEEKKPKHKPKRKK